MTEEENQVTPITQSSICEEDLADMDAMFSKKKKKKKDPSSAKGEVAEEEESYESMLGRIYTLLNVDRTEYVSTRKLLPPNVVRDGTKKSAWTNFRSTCKSLARGEEHLHHYITNEFGTTASIDSDGILILKGRFSRQHIEGVLRKYVTEYVQCKYCRSMNTELQKNSVMRIMVMNCSFCKAQRTVQQIAQAFHATMKGDRKKAAAD